MKVRFLSINLSKYFIAEWYVPSHTLQIWHMFKILENLISHFSIIFKKENRQYDPRGYYCGILGYYCKISQKWIKITLRVVLIIFFWKIIEKHTLQQSGTKIICNNYFKNCFLPLTVTLNAPIESIKIVPYMCHTTCPYRNEKKMNVTYFRCLSMLAAHSNIAVGFAMFRPTAWEKVCLAPWKRVKYGKRLNMDKYISVWYAYWFFISLNAVYLVA